MIKIINKIRNSIAVFLLLAIGGLLAPRLEISQGGCRFNELDVEVTGLINDIRLQQFLYKRSDGAAIFLGTRTIYLLSDVRLRQFLEGSDGNDTFLGAHRIFFGKHLKTFNEITKFLGDIDDETRMAIFDGLGILEVAILFRRFSFDRYLMAGCSTREYISKLAEHCTLREILEFIMNGQDVRIASVSGNNEAVHHLQFNWSDCRSVSEQLMAFRIADRLPTVACRYSFDWQDGMPTITHVGIYPKLRPENIYRYDYGLNCFWRFDSQSLAYHTEGYSGVTLSGDIDSEDQLQDARVEFMVKEEIPKDLFDTLHRLIKGYRFSASSVYALITNTDGGRIAFPVPSTLFTFTTLVEEIKYLNEIITNVPTLLGYLFEALREYGYRYERDKIL